jgi:hypothetical protein
MSCGDVTTKWLSGLEDRKYTKLGRVRKEDALKFPGGGGET